MSKSPRAGALEGQAVDAALRRRAWRRRRRKREIYVGGLECRRTSASPRTTATQLRRSSDRRRGTRGRQRHGRARGGAPGGGPGGGTVLARRRGGDDESLPLAAVAAGAGTTRTASDEPRIGRPPTGRRAWMSRHARAAARRRLVTSAKAPYSSRREARLDAQVERCRMAVGDARVDDPLLRPAPPSFGPVAPKAPPPRRSASCSPAGAVVEQNRAAYDEFAAPTSGATSRDDPQGLVLHNPSRVAVVAFSSAATRGDPCAARRWRTTPAPPVDAAPQTISPAAGTSRHCPARLKGRVPGRVGRARCARTFSSASCAGPRRCAPSRLRASYARPCRSDYPGVVSAALPPCLRAGLPRAACFCEPNAQFALF